MEDWQVLQQLPRCGFGDNTYVVRNRVAMYYKHKGLKTSTVLQKLRKLEKQGLVECRGKDGLGYLWIRSSQPKLNQRQV